MIKEYIEQIKLEYRKMFARKFMYVVCALLILFSIATPIISSASTSKEEVYSYGFATINIHGESIKSDSALYYQIYSYNTKSENASSQSSKADELGYEFSTANLEMFIEFNKYIEDYRDYRFYLVYQAEELYRTIFVLEHQDENIEDLLKAVKKDDYDAITEEELRINYLDLSEDRKMQLLENSIKKLETIKKIFKNNDSNLYLNYMIAANNEKIQSLNDSIKALEKDIIETPANEEVYSKQIEYSQSSIKRIEEIELPILQYELDNNIDFSSDDWRIKAISTKRNAMEQLQTLSVVTQDEFNQNQQLINGYSSYIIYVKDTENKIELQTRNQYVADTSLERGEPDMMFIEDGARKHTMDFLNSSLLVAFIGMIIGGLMIAIEFQTGTVRMLVIRPKTRVTIFLCKFIALFSLCIGLYFAMIIVNFVANGIVFGFKDYAFPLYSINDGGFGMSFLAYYLPKMLACITVIYLACAAAIFFSTMTRNIAIGVSLPIIGIASCIYITEQYLLYSFKAPWAVYTPVPYVYFPKLFLMLNTNAKIEPLIGYGVIALIACATVLVAASVAIFKKKDITN